MRRPSPAEKPEWSRAAKKRLSFLALVAALAVGLVLGGSVRGESKVSDSEGSFVPPEGELSFHPPEFEHHATAADKTVTARFTAYNRTAVPIRITDLETTCSCLSVEADKEVIPPGQSTEIEAVFDIAKIVGNSRKYVVVQTDHPGYETVQLAVKVRIDPIFKIEPKMAEWKLNGDAGPRRIKISVLQETPIHVKSVESSRDEVTPVIHEIKEGREYEIELQIDSTDKPMIGMVKVVTDCQYEQHRNQLLFYAVRPGK